MRAAGCSLPPETRGRIMKIDEFVPGAVRGEVTVFAGPRYSSHAAFSLETALEIVNADAGEVLCVLNSLPPCAEPEAQGLVVLRCVTIRNIAHYVARQIAEKDWHFFALVIIERAWEHSEDEIETIQELRRVAVRFNVVIVVLAPSY